ncbi:hypothetical protein HUU39_11320 [candidate division KSB1 bacterium]|nr:hypothetical protein [bacterium]NUM65848.1 hypothetical protein [candidate division KSB1 bacterium]
MQINRYKVKQKLPRYEFELDNLHQSRYIAPSFHRATSFVYHAIMLVALSAAPGFWVRRPASGT